MYKFLILILLIASVTGCKEVVMNPEPIQPLYLTLARFPKMNDFERDSVLHTDSLEISLFMQYIGKQFAWKSSDNDSLPAIDKVIDQWATSNVAEMFIPPVEHVFPTLEPIERDLGLILANLNDLEIELPRRRFAAVVWSSRTPIVLVDSVVFIALNHFLGADFEGYKSKFYDYQTVYKTPEQLLYAITEAIVGDTYPYKHTEASTALSRMLYEGALIYIKLKVVPNATLASALGYTTDQLEWLDNHYNQIWEYAIGNDIIYTTGRHVASQLVNPSPATSILSPDAPGRAGCYLGYRLILNYITNNAKAPIMSLLQPSFYNNPSELVLAQ